MLAVARHTIQFQRKGDAYGLMLSLFPPIIDMFPNWSGYNVVKEASDGVNDFMRVGILLYTSLNKVIRKVNYFFYYLPGNTRRTNPNV